MVSKSKILTLPPNAHDWLHRVRVAFVKGRSTPLLDRVAAGLMKYLQQMGHTLLQETSNAPDVLLTTALFGEPVRWRESLLLTGRRRFRWNRTPVVFTLLQATPMQIRKTLDHFQAALAKDPPDPVDFDFPGLAPKAYHTLYEQGRRAGPILSLVRLVQSQAMCIRNILVVGEDRPEAQPIEAYTFDLVGAHPRTVYGDPEAFYNDLGLRIVTAASTEEVTDHQVVGEEIPIEIWRDLSTPPAMISAGRELGKRGFFTEMVQVSNLVSAPAVHEAVSSQYSEGCYATWEPALEALITTVTGSARPVDKERLTDDDLTVISGIRPDRKGALVRHVQGKRNDPPSSEAVELLDMDSELPRLPLGKEWELAAQNRVPMVRSKLHGHRGVKSYDPQQVEHVILDAPYYHYPVSCATEAQARAICRAFARSQALADPGDPRQVVFTILPGHGAVIVEKWVTGKAPFQAIWESMDSGALEIDNLVPQGPFSFIADDRGILRLKNHA